MIIMMNARSWDGVSEPCDMHNTKLVHPTWLANSIPVAVSNASIYEAGPFQCCLSSVPILLHLADD